MTTTSRLACMTAAALCLLLGNAHATEPVESPAKPEAASTQENTPQPKPSKEETDKKNASQDKTAKEEPGCD